VKPDAVDDMTQLKRQTDEVRHLTVAAKEVADRAIDDEHGRENLLHAVLAVLENVAAKSDALYDAIDRWESKHLHEQLLKEIGDNEH